MKYTHERTYRDLTKEEEEPAPKLALLLRGKKSIFTKIKEFFKNK